MPPEILIATHNAGKRDELARILGSLPVRWRSLADLNVEVDVAETGASFAENAVIKAVAYSKMTGLWTVADDSGLCVDALAGRPGLLSARYGGGHDVAFPAKWSLLLDELKNAPQARRGAQFRCVLALAEPEGAAVYTREGACAGRIANEPAGSGGFGFDPLFYLPGYGCTLAQVDDATKDRISHRGLAARAMRPIIEQLVLGRR